MKYFSSVALLPLLLAAAGMAQNSSTLLRIRAVDAAGNPITVSKAEVYVDVWGGGEMIPLPVDATQVRIPLDRAWLCDQHPASCEDLFAEGRLVLEAEGYAPVASQAFLWMGAVETPGAAPTSSVDIRFLNGAWMPVAQGETKELTVPFRRPLDRKLHFLNPAGQPISGVGLRVSLLLAASNHCGNVEGKLLAEEVSDEAGVVNVPDADAEVAFDFNKAHHVLLNPQFPEAPMRITAMYPSPINAVLLREMELRPLHLQIAGSEEVSGVTLSACMAACACGACCGQIGESDAAGRIELEDFYPEEYERLTLLDRQGRTVWQSSPRTLEADPVVIELLKTSPVLSEPVPLGRRP